MNRRAPLVSVVVPIYQIERYIGICIESLLNQTYRNLEIVLVNDGSPDRCPEICDLYAAKDARIKVVHKTNGGLVSARKTGLLAATGEYVGYVDGDDWVGPDFYETLVSAALESDADMIAAGQNRVLFSKSQSFLNSVPLGVYEGETLEQLYGKMISNGKFYCPGITTYVWNKLFKREILMEHQLNVDDRITIGEDAAVVYPVMLACKKVAVIDCCSYHYRQREDSMLKKVAPFHEEAKRLKVLYEYLTRFAQGTPKEYRLQSQVDDYVLGICIMRSGGLVVSMDEQDEFMPFEKDFRGKNVLVYSAGTFGQQLVNRLKEASYCTVGAWVDDDYWEYRRCCLDVDSVDSIGSCQFDYVLIATVNGALADEIKGRLQKNGIDNEKILSISCPAQIRKELLKSYFS